MSSNRISKIMDNISCSDLSNLSHELITEENWLLEGQYRVNGLVIAVVLVCFVLIGVPFNILIVGSVIWNKLYDQPSSTPLLNLAITDLLIFIFVVPMNIVPGIKGSFFFGSNDFERCQYCMTGIIFSILIYESFCSVALISFNSFIFIKFPFRYDQIVTVKRMVISILVTWLFTISISLPPIFSFGSIHYSFWVAVCVVDFNSTEYLIVLVASSLIPLFVIVFTNVWLLVIVQRHLRQIYTKNRESLPQEVNNRLNTEYNKKQLNVLRTFVAIFITNVFTWIPVIVLAVIFSILSVPIGYASFAYLVFVSQSMFHPILAFCLITEIKEPIIKLCSKHNIFNVKFNN